MPVVIPYVYIPPQQNIIAKRDGGPACKKAVHIAKKVFSEMNRAPIGTDPSAAPQRGRPLKNDFSALTHDNPGAGQDGNSAPFRMPQSYSDHAETYTARHPDRPSPQAAQTAGTKHDNGKAYCLSERQCAEVDIER